MKRRDETEINWKDYFYYDETSKSHLRRKTEWRCGKGGRILRAQVGAEVGGLNGKYYCLEFGGKTYMCHRVVFSLHHTLGNHLDIDHIDGNRGNNNILNLRAVTPTLNQRNKKMHKSNTSGVIGVSLHSQKRRGVVKMNWCAQWNTVAGKLVNKYFSIAKYGERVAFEMACACRREAVMLLNSEGAGYTERHGQAD